MRTDWLPISSAALVTGSVGLFHGAQTLPRPDGKGEVLRFVAEGHDALLNPALILLLAATLLVFGLPSVATLFAPRARVGFAGLVFLACGSIALAGFSQQLILLRSIVRGHGLEDAAFAAAMADSMQGGMLLAGFAVFYLGEVCVALALLRSPVTPRWIPALLIAHVVVGGGGSMVELGRWEAYPSVLLVGALAGAGIVANRNGHPRSTSSAEVAAMHRAANS